MGSMIAFQLIVDAYLLVGVELHSAGISAVAGSLQAVLVYKAFRKYST